MVKGEIKKEFSKDDQGHIESLLVTSPDMKDLNNELHADKSEWFVCVVIVSSTTFMYYIYCFNLHSKPEYMPLAEIIIFNMIAGTIFFQAQKNNTLSDDLISFLYKFPISKLTKAEANQVEMLVTTLVLEKPELRASNIFTVGTNLLSSIEMIITALTAEKLELTVNNMLVLGKDALSSILANVVMYVLVTVQFVISFSK
uniref:Uncharacterized protein LOC114339068 n=1 Tax=Diabrotica virgifera virgifera TaxID=50390 RepID=A0A6P7G8L0_DIAVI